MVSEKRMGAGGGLYAGIPRGKARPVPHDAGAESDLYPCGTGATDTAITECAGSARTERTRAERCRFPPYPAGSSGKRQRQDSSYHRPTDPVSEPRHPLSFFQMRPGLHRPDVSQIHSGYRQLQPGQLLSFERGAAGAVSKTGGRRGAFRSGRRDGLL